MTPLAAAYDRNALALAQASLACLRALSSVEGIAPRDGLEGDVVAELVSLEEELGRRVARLRKAREVRR